MENKVEVFDNCGEEFFLLDSKLLENIIKLGEYNGIKVKFQDLNGIFTPRVKFAELNKGFHCGITRRLIAKKLNIWEPFLFYEIGQEWQRVVLEKSGCLNCDWKGIVANPTLPGLYLLTANNFELRENVKRLKQVQCPKCSGKLERFAIWAGEEEQG